MALSAVQHDKELAQLLCQTCQTLLPQECAIWTYWHQQDTFECQATIGPVDQTSPPDHDVLTYAMDQQHLFVQHQNDVVFAAVPLRHHDPEPAFFVKTNARASAKASARENTRKSGASSAPTPRGHCSKIFWARFR